MTVDASQVDTVAGFTMTIAVAEPSSEAEERWSQRAEVLAQWLGALWREQGETEK